MLWWPCEEGVWSCKEGVVVLSGGFGGPERTQDLIVSTRIMRGLGDLCCGASPDIQPWEGVVVL